VELNFASGDENDEDEDEDEESIHYQVHLHPIYALTMHSLCTHYALTMHSLCTHYVLATVQVWLDGALAGVPL
jgi:hypothetical protein